MTTNNSERSVTDTIQERAREFAKDFDSFIDVKLTDGGFNELVYQVGKLLRDEREKTFEWKKKAEELNKYVQGLCVHYENGKTVFETIKELKAEIQSLTKKLEEAEKQIVALVASKLVVPNHPTESFDKVLDVARENTILQSKLLSIEAMNGMMINFLTDLKSRIYAEIPDEDFQHTEESHYENLTTGVLPEIFDDIKKILSKDSIQQQIKINEASNKVIEKAIKVRGSKDHQEFIWELFDELSNLEKLKNE